MTRSLGSSRGVDHIVHAGDVGDEAILERLRTLAPLTAVAGNIDDFQCGDAGTEARAELGGVRLYVTHILDRPSRPMPESIALLNKHPADIVVFGHSHCRITRSSTGFSLQSCQCRSAAL